VTILLSDIRNFTTISERMAPEEVVSFLNDYFSEMVDAVFEHDGMLDKFMGDGLMAVFGVFGETSDHQRKAVRAALRMKALLANQQAVGGESRRQSASTFTDEVIVGNIRSPGVSVHGDERRRQRLVACGLSEIRRRAVSGPSRLGGFGAVRCRRRHRDRAKARFCSHQRQGR
jgi:class 3 adenylate cyclase